MSKAESRLALSTGGSKENVIPSEAEALVNHRILPGYSTADVLKYDQDLVEDIPNVSVEIYRVRISDHIKHTYRLTLHCMLQEKNRNTVRDLESRESNARRILFEVLSMYVESNRQFFDQDTGTEPVSASPYDRSSFGFRQIKKTTQQIHPTALVAPSLMVANTDTTHYFKANLTRNIYR